MKNLEIHIDLEHADLRRSDGTVDPERVARLCQVLGGLVAETVTSGDQNGIIMSFDKKPMAYWLIGKRKPPTAPPDEED
jgi:hypothetical protein